MAPFKVINVIDGDTIKVSPGYTWSFPNGITKSGDTLKILGYILPKKQTYAYNYAKQKLESLLLNKNVVLKNPHLIIEEGIHWFACEVFIDNVTVSFYFPEYRVI